VATFTLAVPGKTASSGTAFFRVSVVARQRGVTCTSHGGLRVQWHSFCVNLRSFCGENCEATFSKLLILLNGFRVGCEAITAKLLILLKSCVSVCFSGKKRSGVELPRRSDAGELRRARVWLFFVIIPIRLFPVEFYIDCATERGN